MDRVDLLFQHPPTAAKGPRPAGSWSVQGEVHTEGTSAAPSGPTRPALPLLRCALLDSWLDVSKAPFRDCQKTTNFLDGSKG